MTIASAFNEIAVAQGGTAAKSGAITAAIDALNDALAGSDQPQAKTIEQAVRLLGEHIGGGGGGTHAIHCFDSDFQPCPSFILAAAPTQGTHPSVVPGGSAIDSAQAGALLSHSDSTEIGGVYGCTASTFDPDYTYSIADAPDYFVMPEGDIYVVAG